MVPEVKPTDRGYAWMILIGATLNMILSIGIVKTSGLFFVAFQERFQSSSSMTSLLSTVQNICFSITSLLAMTVGIKVTTCRNLVFAGSTLLCISFIVTSQAEHISLALFSYGAMMGVAVALNETALLVMLGTYFEKRRGLANSISSSGSCIGGLVFAPLVAKLLSAYGFKGCLLILAGILFNGCISGALFRPISFYATKKENEVVLLEKDTESREKLGHEAVDDTPCEQNTAKPSKKLTNRVASLKSNDIERSHSANAVNEDAETIRLGQIDKPLLESPKRPNDNEKNYDKYRHFLKSKRQRTVSESVASSVMEAISNSSVARYTSYEYIGGSIVDISLNDTEVREMTMSSTKGTTQSKEIWKNIFSSCLSIVDFALFKRPVFVCFLVAACTICPGTVLSQVFIPPYAKDIGISVDDLATLITIQNVIDIFARISLGFIADRGWLRRSTLAAIATTIVAIIAHLLRFYSSYKLLIVYVVLLGLVGGVYFSLFPVILVDYMTLEKLHSCIGFISLCHGCSVAGGYYIIGYLRDVTGSYLISYHVLGVMLSVGAVILFLLPLIERKTNGWK